MRAIDNLLCAVRRRYNSRTIHIVLCTHKAYSKLHQSECSKSFTKWNGFHLKVFRPSLCEVAQTLLRVYFHRFFSLHSHRIFATQAVHFEPWNFQSFKILRSTFIFVSFAWHATVWMLFFSNYLTECMTFLMRTKRALEWHHLKVNLLLLDRIQCCSH